MVRRIVLAAAIVVCVYYGVAWCREYFSDFRQKTTDQVESKPKNEEGKPDDPITKTVRERRARERAAGEPRREADDAP